MSANASATAAKVRKFPCEGCGADIRWDPSASALKCPYCGAVKQIAPTTADGVREKPIEAALRAPRDLGWGAERKVIACKRCGAHTTLEPHVAAGACVFCGTAAVVEAPANQNIVRPEGLLPFKVNRDGAVASFQKWVSGLWFRPNDLKSTSRLTNMRGAYIPFWTFDAATNSHWTAEAGYHYYETEWVTENGQRVSKQVQRTRWEYASGWLDMFFDDVPVPASHGIPSPLAKEIEPFPTEGLIEYDPRYLSGFMAEENAIDLPEALETAKERMRGEIRSACVRDIPGDTYRNLDVDTSFSALAYKNALLPIWVCAYEYGGKAYRFLVNGVTGKASGTAPLSWAKITMLLLFIFALVITYVALKQP
jgi:hypothetical protein